MKKIKLMLAVFLAGAMLVGCASTSSKDSGRKVVVEDRNGKQVKFYEDFEELKPGKKYKLLNTSRGTEKEKVENIENSYNLYLYEGEKDYPSAEIRFFGDESNLKKHGYWYGSEIEWRDIGFIESKGFIFNPYIINNSFCRYDKNGKQTEIGVKIYVYDFFEPSALDKLGLTTVSDSTGNKYFAYKDIRKPQVGKKYTLLNFEGKPKEQKYGSCYQFYLYEVGMQIPSLFFNIEASSDFLKSKGFWYGESIEWKGLDDILSQGFKNLEEYTSYGVGGDFCPNFQTVYIFAYPQWQAYKLQSEE